MIKPSPGFKLPKDVDVEAFVAEQIRLAQEQIQQAEKSAAGIKAQAEELAAAEGSTDEEVIQAMAAPLHALIRGAMPSPDSLLSGFQKAVSQIKDTE